MSTSRSATAASATTASAAASHGSAPAAAASPATVAITGASSGIGLATARLLARRGAHLSLLARRSDVLASVADELRSAGAAAGAAAGSEVLAVAGDVGEPADLSRFAATTAERFGGVDGLFLNAGTAPFAALADVTPALVDACLAVNVRGTLLGVQQFAPHLRQGASVLLTGSALHHRPVPGSSVWAASTWAVRGLAAALAVELAPSGVRVNTLSHGPVDTPVYEGYGMPAEAVAATKASLAAGTLLGRMADPDEIAELAAVLLVGTAGPATGTAPPMGTADPAGYITGTEIVADGGWALAARAGVPAGQL